MIEAGTTHQVCWGDGNWVFLDCGFSSKRPTCGIVIGNDAPELMTFGKARRTILEHIRRSNGPVSLVLEAPLSVAFSKEGNPRPRSLEREVANGKTRTRYWYNGLGTTVMISAMYLVSDIMNLSQSVRLFEGFVSYKERTAKSDHCKDVRLLRQVVRDPERFSDSIFAADSLRINHDDDVFSAFKILGLECGIPTIIKPSLQVQESLT